MRVIYREDKSRYEIVKFRNWRKIAQDVLIDRNLVDTTKLIPSDIKRYLEIKRSLHKFRYL